MIFMKWFLILYIYSYSFSRDRDRGPINILLSSKKFPSPYLLVVNMSWLLFS